MYSLDDDDDDAHDDDNTVFSSLCTKKKEKKTGLYFMAACFIFVYSNERSKPKKMEKERNNSVKFL